MSLNLNLCTAVLPKFSFEDVIDIASVSGYQGIELRVSDNYHKSLQELSGAGAFIRRKIERSGLSVPVLNTYIPVEDEKSVDQLLECCQRMGIPKARLVLPKSCCASVARQANVKEIIPSFEADREPMELMETLKKTLHKLEYKAEKAGVKILLELHWGTVMSSFSSAYMLTYGLDPKCIGITFDPANMMVEGKEDWEFGLKLIRSHIDNVHVKNMSWFAGEQGWSWEWAAVTVGMVNWPELICLLEHNRYLGDYAIEDFLVPNYSKQAAIAYLSWVNEEFSEIYEHMSAVTLRSRAIAS
ncbi:MAG: sugar phosphate isomerase/epimerase [Desmonostoc vinosum HA7617-LM4]|jgi:sugar phosphate isomerase/epimerase|nr:sugar phosphate isomerase/epimerase [Desmonostoc vinosum HA7617-LM4]